jgi:hypothetical protein
MASESAMDLIDRQNWLEDLQQQAASNEARIHPLLAVGVSIIFKSAFCRGLSISVF